MSLLHSRPVPAQQVYYKPSTMARLKAMFRSRRYTHARPLPRAAAPVPVAAAPRRLGHGRRVRQPIRQPVRKTGFGFFHRSSPHRTVIASQRRPGFLASLRPRHHHHHRTTHRTGNYRQGGHKASKVAALLAIVSLKKKHGHDAHRRRADRHYRY
ncbi:hypothetical protein BC939DRAFT_452493 [Gamsiella multidivaricata]|uniref:uncharacterized protein n=1 Tax=Gamsiella multidivaricata TaxID=101098 RepID=UPI00222089CB|nr:uncharacterized protein BC939DRAFT_452493 [Gamsiella multidivaricata]KAI7823001.1 hypothetical protein BC939DRAFT_452493 [Gamsiella multidivaricata]